MQVGGERKSVSRSLNHILVANTLDRLTVPAKLAYGKDGNGDIPRNATLTFEVRAML